MTDANTIDAMFIQRAHDKLAAVVLGRGGEVPAFNNDARHACVAGKLMAGLDLVPDGIVATDHARHALRRWVVTGGDAEREAARIAIITVLHMLGNELDRRKELS